MALKCPQQFSELNGRSQDLKWLRHLKFTQTNNIPLKHCTKEPGNVSNESSIETYAKMDLAGNRLHNEKCALIQNKLYVTDICGCGA